MGVSTIKLVMKKIGAPAVPHLVPHLDSPNAEARRRIVMVLEGLDTSESTEALRRALQDEHKTVGKIAERILKKRGQIR